MSTREIQFLNFIASNCIPGFGGSSTLSYFFLTRAGSSSIRDCKGTSQRIRENGRMGGFIVLDGMTCTFLPGKISKGESVPPIYNEVYRYWRETWGKIFKDAGSPESLNAENFLRQDAIIVLHDGSSVAGIVGTTFFNLGAHATFDHAYLRPFPEPLVSELRARGCGFVSTAEYLCVHPNFRKGVVGVSLSEVLVGLNLKLFSELGGTATLGTSVRPARTHEGAMRYGYCEVGKLEKYGLDCLLLCNTPEQLCINEDKSVAALVERLWSQRIDLTGLTGARIIPFPEKKAA